LGWPKCLLGTQSRDWAFDVTAYLRGDSPNEHVACEVKKAEFELEQLIDLMRRFGAGEPNGNVRRGKELNALRKLQGLRSRRAPLFWAVGPDDINFVFRVTYSDGDRVTFEEASVADLKYLTS
jgi:hypothetical protein